MTDSEKRDVQIDDVAALLRRLTSHLMQSGSISDLFGSGFRVFCDVMAIDVAIAVVLEQNLCVYVSTRRAARSLVDDALMERVRRALETQLSLSFASADVLVRSELNDLPGDDRAMRLPHELSAVLEVENHPAGLLILFRESPPFSAQDASVLEIFSTHVALHMGSLRARERMMQMADTDDLTGIANKRHFRRRLLYEMDRARAYSVPLTLLILDIDDFKLINDTFGHTIGDVVLSEFCGATNDMLRPPDFFARFGGDEFAVILPHTDTAGASAVSERILAHIRDMAVWPDERTEVHCTVSIGIAEFRPEDVIAEELIRRADLRLYDSKRLGKNRYTA